MISTTNTPNVSVISGVTTPFISCGMYAFTDDLKLAWRALFECFHRLGDEGETLDSALRFDTDDTMLCDEDLFLAHTCGYTLVKTLRDQLSSVCTPIFDVAVRDGVFYRSTFITSADSKIESLEDSYRGVGTFNNWDSNSGMNVFRHALAPLAHEKSKEKGNQNGKAEPFFSDLIESGSHHQSVLNVVEGRADVAAIDSVSLALIVDAWPELATRIKTIGYSAKTCGLPFVIPTSSLALIDTRRLTLRLNEALAMLPDQTRQCLHLVEFADVELSQYQSILDLEQQAIDMGYPDLI